MRSDTRASLALTALVVVLGITASWWALALWPLEPTAPEWLMRTRLVCFGSTATGLPHAGGWLLLIGQPLGMLLVLTTVWRDELTAGVRAALSRIPGQVAAGTLAAALVAGSGGVAARVAGAGEDLTFPTGANQALAAQLTRVDDAAPGLSLVDQGGAEVTLEQFRGRPVLVTFAYAHCETVCPLVVSDVVTAARSLVEAPRESGSILDATPVVLIITLDPWRDTPSRLPALAATWQLPQDARVLSGDPEEVERTLSAWRVPRIRNEKTGDISHPGLVYVIGPDGRITYVLAGSAGAITAAVRAL